MRLQFLHPQIAARSCGDCRTHLYDDTPQRMGLPVIRGGRHVERAKGQPTPCRWCPKIAMGDDPKPENATELSERNGRALVHYLECRAVGRFPGDAWVRRNAAVIRAVMDEAADLRQTETMLNAIGAMFVKGAG